MKWEVRSVSVNSLSFRWANETCWFEESIDADYEIDWLLFLFADWQDIYHIINFVLKFLNIWTTYLMQNYETFSMTIIIQDFLNINIPLINVECENAKTWVRDCSSALGSNIEFYLGLNEMYVWFLLPTYPSFFNPTLNIKMVFGEKYLKWALF